MDLVRITNAPASLSGAQGDWDFVRIWLGQYQSSETLRAYRREAERLLDWLGKPLAQVTLKDLQAYAQYLQAAGLSDSARRRALFAVKSLLGFAQKTGYLRWDVGRAIKPPKEQQTLTGRILSESEVLTLINAPRRFRDRVLLRTLYLTGLRVSELCAATWERMQVDADGSAVLEVTGKGNKVRYVRLPAELVRDLRKLGTKGALFTSQKRSPITPQQVRNIVAQAAERAGLGRRVSPHWLRHCAASHALRRGMPVTDVAAILGHSSVAVTSRYLHANPRASLAEYLPS